MESGEIHIIIVSHIFFYWKGVPKILIFLFMALYLSYLYHNLQLETKTY